ncbi:MAG: hypothetical protein IKP78_01080 [Ruminococcus sp.]|nr:hypothetical protein [Ruminococcus sp.]
MNKLVAFLSAAVVAAASIPFLGGADSVAGDTDTIKIMCIGDSITDGYVPDYAGSYRKFLYHGLTEKGYNIDMVGSKDGGYAPTYTDSATGESFEFDNENTGYSGYSIKAYPGRNGILETLQQTNCLQEKQPDIVTLQIGTNNIIDNHDMSGSRGDLEELITYILENIPEDSALFVTGIPDLDPNREGVYDWFSNYRHSADWQTQYDDATAEANIHKAVAEYNTIVETTVKQMQSTHKNIRPAYVQTAVTDVKSQLFDGVHPNNVGYKAMGEYWTELLADYLGGGAASGTTTTATTATSTETTTATTTTTTTAYQLPRYGVSDLVLLSRFLLGEKVSPFDEHTRQNYDFCEDGKLDMFDLVQMRRYLCENPLWD